MRAMVYRRPNRIRVEEKDIPAIEHPNDAIVRVTRAAICGSDLHLYHGMMPDTRVGISPGPWVTLGIRVAPSRSRFATEPMRGPRVARSGCQH
jgi:threonine dehydrogenase-like Zn-dependent dehydrogenase